MVLHNKSILVLAFINSLENYWHRCTSLCELILLEWARGGLNIAIGIFFNVAQPTL